MMKKTLVILLTLLLCFSAVPAFAAPVVISYDFEAYANTASAQDTSAWTWITFNQWETQWLTSNFADTDTWVEPADRTDAVGGTTMRIYTKDATTLYAEGKRAVYLNRPRGVAMGAAHYELWYKFDWMVEDHNADHKILMYLDNQQNEIFSIDTSGALKTLAGETGITIEAGKWYTYEMCMSKTDGLLFYLDGQLVNIKASKDAGGVWNAQNTLLLYQKLYNDGNGYYKGSGMQIDNFFLTVCDSVMDKRLYGISDSSFTEGSNNSGITFSVKPYNFKSESLPYLMIVSVYNENGEYVGYESASGTLGANTARDSAMPLSVSFGQWGSGFSAKAYILNGWTNRTGFVTELYTYTDITE